MAQHEKRHVEGLGDGDLSAQDLCYVVKDRLGWACKAFFRGLGDGATPTTLVEAMGLDGVCGGKVRKEGVIGVHMVREAMDK